MRHPAREVKKTPSTGRKFPAGAGVDSDRFGW